jgi:hypothetical protein
MGMCWENISFSECEEIRAEGEAPEDGWIVDFMNSCPAGQVHRCDIEEDGIVYYVRYYGEYYEDFTCEDF